MSKSLKYQVSRKIDRKVWNYVEFKYDGDIWWDQVFIKVDNQIWDKIDQVVENNVQENVLQAVRLATARK
jgi:hypothetical protein